MRAKRFKQTICEDCSMTPIYPEIRVITSKVLQSKNITRILGSPIVKYVIISLYTLLSVILTYVAAFKSALLSV
jgi:hypothetical protein